MLDYDILEICIPQQFVPIYGILPSFIYRNQNILIVGLSLMYLALVISRLQ